MAKLSDLTDLRDEPVAEGPANWEDIPEQRGAFAPLPQPGTFSFELPANIDDAYGKVPESLVASFNLKGDRAEVRFDAEHPLVIVESRDGKYNGQNFDTSVNTVEKNRAPKGSPEVKVPDMIYLLQALGETDLPKLGESKKMLTLLSKYAKQRFTAEIEWRASSKSTKVRYIYDAEGKVVEDPEKKNGSGKKWYQSQIPRGEGGEYLERFGDPQPDGSVEAIRCFASLSNFRAYKK